MLVVILLTLYFSLQRANGVFYNFKTANLSHLSQSKIIELSYINDFYDQYNNNKRFKRNIDEAYFQYNNYEIQMSMLENYVNLYKSIKEEDIALIANKQIFFLDRPHKKKNIKWFFNDTNVVKVYPHESQNIKNLLHYGFSTWEQYIDISFEYVEKNYDIYISFEKYEHCDGSPFDGPGGVNAHAFLPSSNLIPLLIHFDISEKWQFQYKYINNDQVFFIETAIHEIGHSLGLRHPFLIPQSVMHGLDIKNSFYKRNMHISNYDISSIRKLYKPKIIPEIEKIISDRQKDENQEEYEFLLYRKNQRLEKLSNLILNIKKSLNLKSYLPSVSYEVNSRIYDVLLNEYQRSIQNYYIDGDYNKLIKSYENLYRSSNNLPSISVLQIPDILFCNSTFDSIIFIEGMLYITKEDKIWKQVYTSHSAFYGPFSIASFLNNDEIKTINGAYKKNNESYIFLSKDNLYEIKLNQNKIKIHKNVLNITSMAPFFYDDAGNSVIAIANIGGCPKYITFHQTSIPSMTNYNTINLNFYPYNIKFIFNYGEKIYLVSKLNNLIIINFGKKIYEYSLEMQPWLNCEVSEINKKKYREEKEYFNTLVFRKVYVNHANDSLMID